MGRGGKFLKEIMAPPFFSQQLRWNTKIPNFSCLSPPKKNTLKYHTTNNDQPLLHFFGKNMLGTIQKVRTQKLLSFWSPPSPWTLFKLGKGWFYRERTFLFWHPPLVCIRILWMVPYHGVVFEIFRLVQNL